MVYVDEEGKHAELKNRLSKRTKQHEYHNLFQLNSVDLTVIPKNAAWISYLYWYKHKSTSQLFGAKMCGYHTVTWVIMKNQHIHQFFRTHQHGCQFLSKEVFMDIRVIQTRLRGYHSYSNQTAWISHLSKPDCVDMFWNKPYIQHIISNKAVIRRYSEQLVPKNRILST